MNSESRLRSRSACAENFGLYQHCVPLFSLAALLFYAHSVAQNAVPLPHAHAHNDYLHDRPLFEALQHGFTSIEVDIHLKDGDLLVGHDHDDLIPGRTIEQLYLAPLHALIERYGKLYGRPYPLQLLVDIKTEPVATYRALKTVLSRYRDMLTVFSADSVQPGMITVIISGNRSAAEMMADPRSYAAYDGRISDLDGAWPPHFMPLVSDNWNRHFSWRGTGPMPREELEKLKNLVKKTHAQGRMIRFWATDAVLKRERSRLWSALLEAGVDWINTDHLGELRTYMLENHKSFGTGDEK
jgi:glycerophosphoryl diester phosphodiesterase